jgi:hypothetical protein
MTKELKELIAMFNIYDCTVEEFEDLMQQAYAIDRNEWVSVEERLPDIESRYLILDDDGDVSIDMFINGKFEDYVTHWMPLPKPPIDLLNR